MRLTAQPERAARLGDAGLPAAEKKKDEELVVGIARCLSVAGYTAVKVREPVLPRKDSEPSTGSQS
jgi:hypothetical protein